jgi:UDP-glucose 4-epimerase
LNRYGTLKLQLENYLLNLAEAYELSATVLRISNPYGGMFNGFFQTGFINQALYNVHNNTPINIWGNGTQIRDFIHISDLCKYMMGAISLEGVQVLNIGTGKGYSLLEVVENLSKVYGKNIAVNFHSDYIEQVTFNVLDISKSLDLLKTSPSFDLIRGLQLEKNAYVV